MSLLIFAENLRVVNEHHRSGRWNATVDSTGSPSISLSYFNPICAIKRYAVENALNHLLLSQPLTRWVLCIIPGVFRLRRIVPETGRPASGSFLSIHSRDVHVSCTYKKSLTIPASSRAIAVAGKADRAPRAIAYFPGKERQSRRKICRSSLSPSRFLLHFFQSE